MKSEDLQAVINIDYVLKTDTHPLMASCALETKEQIKCNTGCSDICFGCHLDIFFKSCSRQVPPEGGPGALEGTTVCLMAGLGMPSASPRGARGGVWAEKILGILAETAAA